MRKFHILSSIALAFSLFFTLGSAATQAQDGSEFAGGNGTESNPWQIATKQQLLAVNNYVREAGRGKHFILTKDLIFTAEDFTPFGDFDNTNGQLGCIIGHNDNGAVFQGTFDGGNHEINGLKDSDGLFIGLENATVKNLVIFYESLTGGVDGKGSGICYFFYNSVIDNCHVRGNCKFSIESGGLIGRYTGGVGYIINSSFKGSIDCDGKVGGIAGDQNGDGTLTIADSFVEADISGIGDGWWGAVGGLIGLGTATIQNCYVKGNISGNGPYGGFIGVSWWSRNITTTIKESYFEGNITSHTTVGGLIGHSDTNVNISKSYSKGILKIDNGMPYHEYLPVSAGGFIGSIDSGVLAVGDSYTHCNISVIAGTYSIAAGGIVGCGKVGTVSILRSYAMGEIKGDQSVQASVSGNHAYVGGLSGGHYLEISNASILKSVAMNPSLTVPHGDKADTGRIIGEENGWSLVDNYALDTMTLKISNKDVSVTGMANDKNGLAKSASALAQKSIYTGLGWDFDEVWKMSVNGYPILAWQKDAPLPTAPSITSQPKSQTVNTGSSVTFSVTATGTDPLSYQWYKNSSAISGATKSSYTINSVTTGDAGSYYVVVSNDLGTVTSSAATLTVNVPVTLSSITINGNSSVNVGSTATYTCIATYSNGTTKTVTPTWSISSGASYASITSAGVLTGKAAGTATVKATYEGKTATKNVTVNAVKPTITTQPKSQTVNEGNSVTFSVVATGTAPLSYQWYKDGKAISGATGSSYTISSAKGSDAGSYYVIVSNTAGNATSSTVTLTVILKPVITVQPRSLVVDEDDPATFSVTATGTAPLSYQWYKDGRAISGATGSSYTINSAKKSDEGSYYVIVRNNAGSVTSNTVTLTVNKLEPDGTAIRSISINGLTATVTLTVVPNKAVNVYFIEENIPAIGTIIPNDGGVYTASKNVIRWSFLDNASRVVSYTVTVPNYLDNVVYVNGTVTFDTNVRAITGDNALDFTLKTHPADTNENFEITTPEVSLYAVAWKLGQNWSREPVDIPMNYVSRAALIWVNGGDYIYDASKAKPFCWVDATARAASEEEPAVSTSERKISVADGKADVAIELVPAEGISVYLVEEQLPADMTLNVTDISDGGNYIPEKNVIRWSFLDGTPRTLTYTLEPEEGFVGTIALNGEVMFDEETFTIEGDTEAVFRPVIHFILEDGGKTLVLDFVGTLYESEDTVNWTEVEGAESPFKVDVTQGKKFYRSVK